MEGIERTKQEEEERRGSEPEALPNRDHDHSLRRFLVLCSSCDRRLVLYLRLVLVWFVSIHYDDDIDGNGAFSLIM